ncbi:hypothetical protein SUGI_0670610 [Cryptomeria japonica]|uniref:protein RKD1 n=1 Tax=Cryptomeria japonica TaxID=3369 RepID=UPI0024148E7F|nr:protein RKD1 [Cryptomeria japonica]GLJ33331.1 hypothetical protein SUGI_0670610 [Cryptomeria japonica]
MQQAKQEEQQNLNLMSDHDVWQSIFESYSAAADPILDQKLGQSFNIDINSRELYATSDQLWVASDINIMEEDKGTCAKHLLSSEFELGLENVPTLTLCDSLEDLQGCTPQDCHTIKAWDSQITIAHGEELPYINAENEKFTIVAVEESVNHENLWTDQCEWASVYYCEKSSGQEILPNPNSLLLEGTSTKHSVSNEKQQQKVCASWSGPGEYESRPSFSTKNTSMHCQQRSDISYSELSQYFHMPITQAAKELKVGLTVLKKRCREFGIPRWPHRKMKSLGNLINNIQELVKSNAGVSQARLTNAVEILKEQKRLMEEIPGIELDERTKRLRQACFKANYKKRRAAQNNIKSSNTTSSGSSCSSDQITCFSSASASTSSLSSSSC